MNYKNDNNRKNQIVIIEYLFKIQFNCLKAMFTIGTSGYTIM